MKVLVLDDGRKRIVQMQDELGKKNIETVLCSTSNSFMDAVGTANFDSFLINVDTWEKGRAIYDYFGIGRKIEQKPVIFYNADETFTSVNNRIPNDKDQVLYKPVDIDAVVGAL